METVSKQLFLDLETDRRVGDLGGCHGDAWDYAKIFDELNVDFREANSHALCVLGDSLKVLHGMKTSSVHLIFADAPYNIGKDFGNNQDRWESTEAYVRRSQA